MTADEGTRRGLWLVTPPVLALGAVEGWYGKTVAGDVYGSDAVQYLDLARAMERGDWHSALNLLWSQGYPALLAVVRPMWAAGNAGEWNAIRWLNFAIFALCWAAFGWLVRELRPGRPVWIYAACVFVTTQVLMDQVSRVGPDQLVAAIFFAVCAVLLRMRRGEGGVGWLGLLLGVGFLVKSIFLPLGCVALGVALVSGWPRRGRVVASGVVFAAIVLAYGAGLSRAVGAPTLGEAGSLNYAWHVNRLAKWVHWEGGADPAEKAWPKPALARFARWREAPPDFGRPVHPSRVIGAAPGIYAFRAPVEATYVPYFNPPYFYQGYRHVVNWRYQVIALGKNTVDLITIVAKQPLCWAILLVWALAYREVRRRCQEVWPVVAPGVAGVAIYLPVHLEGRYVAPFLAVLAMVVLERIWPRRVFAGLVVAAFCMGLVRDQREVWGRGMHRWDYRSNLEWREGEALHLTPGAEIGVISWTPNLQCDWAYLAGVRITSEIASAEDEKAFWGLPAMERNIVLMNFRQAGAEAVVTRDAPPGDAAGWEKLDGVPVWVYRF